MRAEQPDEQHLRVLTRDDWSAEDSQWEQRTWLACGICATTWELPQLDPMRVGRIFSHALGHVRWHDLRAADRVRLARPRAHV